MSTMLKGSDEWRTPKWLREIVCTHWAPTHDLAATEDNAIARKFYTQEQSFLRARTWDGVAWCNPPFSMAADFFEAIATAKRPAVCIYKSSNMETKPWQRWILPHCDWIFQPSRRISYEDTSNATGESGPKFPSALIGFGGVSIPPSWDTIAGRLLMVQRP